MEPLRPVDELVAQAADIVTGNHGRNTYDAGAPLIPLAAAAAAAGILIAILLHNAAAAGAAFLIGTIT